MIEAKKALWLSASKHEKFMKKVKKIKPHTDAWIVVEELITKYLNEK